MRVTLRGEQWRDCDYCGFKYPISLLRREIETGRLACTVQVRDYSPPGRDYINRHKRYVTDERLFYDLRK